MTLPASAHPWPLTWPLHPRPKTMRPQRGLLGTQGSGLREEQGEDKEERQLGGAWEEPRG